MSIWGLQEKCIEIMPINVTVVTIPAVTQYTLLLPGSRRRHNTQDRQETQDPHPRREAV